MSPTLPTEILETVIDATRNDRKTLAACGAAGRQLLVRSRVHLFAEVVLGSPSTNPTRHQSTLHTLYPSSPTRCDLLWELVEANPTLTRHVTKLTLSEGAEPNVTMYWISQSTTLVPIVRCLSNLRVFTLREGQGSQWSPVLIQAMHLCFHAPLIESVELAGLYVTELPSLFAIFSTSRPGMALQKLGLSNLMIRDVPLGNEQLGQRERNLRAVYTLDISSPHQRDSQRPVFGLFSRSPPLINLSRLHHLGLTIGDDLWLVSQWIDLVAASLVQLHLKFKHYWTLYEFSAPQEEIHLPQLFILRFEISVSGAISAVLSILRMLKAPILSDIVFLLLQDGHAVDDSPQWSALDSVISRQFFPSLTTVRFESVSADGWQPILRERLPNLNKSKMLILDAKV